MTIEKNNIYLGDCLELLSQMSDNSVDVSITSPPYADTGSENEWDNPNNKSNHKKYLNVETHHTDWFDWQVKVIDELLRVTKKTVIYNIQALKHNRPNVYKLLGHYNKEIQDVLIWCKSSGTPSSTPNAISNMYEFILLLRPKGVDRIKANSTFMTNLINDNGIKGRNPYANIHKAVMPQALCSKLINEFTQEGDIILDPFSGMATTAVCALQSNRNYIGFELCEEYYNESIKRIDGVKQQEMLF